MHLSNDGNSQWAAPRHVLLKLNPDPALLFAELSVIQRKRRRRAMEHSYSNSGISNYSSTKEKRPPLKRGQLKRQIVRTISNLMAPRNDGAGADKRASGGAGFGTYN
ncbi:hypothetical protein D1007_10452 [Hordeum vulgare]|nr:hypothetical protein D1007_10452 [Hordeum vulgare]